MRCPADGSLDWAGKLVIPSVPSALAPTIYYAGNVWSDQSSQETICLADDWQVMAYCAKQMWAHTNKLTFVANEINLSWLCVQTCCVGAEGPGVPLYLLLIQEHQDPLDASLPYFWSREPCISALVASK